MEYYNENTGLNGIFGWARRNLMKIAGVVTIFNPALGGALTLLSMAIGTGEEEGGDEGKMSFTEPTVAEQRILDKWVNEVLTPFYKNLAIQIKDVFGGNISPSEQLQIVNEVMAKMCVVRAYYANNETAGLSDNAVAARLDVIDKLFNIIDDMINDSFTSNAIVLDNYSFKVTNTSLFAPINIPANANYSCQRYVNNVPVSQQNVPILTVTPVVVNPVTGQPITIKNNPVTGQPVSAVIDEPIKINPATGQPVIKDNNKTIAIVLVGAAVLVGLFYKQKKSIKI